MKSNPESTSTVKILVLAIHGPYEPWLSILRAGQMKTWMNHSSDIRIVNVFGREIQNRWLKLDQKAYFLRWSSSKLIAYSSLIVEAGLKKILLVNRIRPTVIQSSHERYGEVWEIQMPDSLMLQGVKNLAAIRESLNHEYDFLVTTITSSYINLEALLGKLTLARRRSFIGGRIEKSGSMSFQQGSFRVYSRDVVEYLISNASSYKHWKIEDIAMGHLVATNYHDYVEIPNLTVNSLEELNKYSTTEIKDACSIRCKSVEPNGDRNDASIMKAIDLLLENY